MKTIYKRDFQKFLMVLCSVIAVTVLLMVAMDPFYQYHAPWFGMPVVLDNEVYQTPGAARNLKYTDAIVGTSMTENFHTGWFDEELGWNTMKLSYSGARSEDLRAILGQIFSREEQTNHIFMDINDYQLTVSSWTTYVERPEYLYTASVMDDYRYLFNRDVLASGWQHVLDGLSGVTDNIDAAYTWEEPELFGKQAALADSRKVREQLLEGQSSVTDAEENSTDRMLAVCQENLDNILPFIKAHPDTEFIIYFPPYSMLYWEQKVLNGKLQDMLRVYGYAIEQFLQYDNVKVYYFQNEKEIITDLDNYRDSTHHRPEYNKYIFDCIKNGENRITKDNLEQQLLDMYEFALDFDYDACWIDYE